MSFIVELKNEKSLAVVLPHKIGDTYFMDGSTEAKAEISYKYAQVLKLLDSDLGLKWLSGKAGKETVQNLERCAMILGTEPGEDNWRTDNGTVGFILKTFAQWATANPNAIWEVT